MEQQKRLGRRYSGLRIRRRIKGKLVGVALTVRIRPSVSKSELFGQFPDVPVVRRLRCDFFLLKISWKRNSVYGILDPSKRYSGPGTARQQQIVIQALCELRNL